MRAVPWTRYTREVAARLEMEGLGLPAHVPPVALIQGSGPGGPAQVGDPELEYGQAREAARCQREEDIQAIEQGREEEEHCPVPIPVNDQPTS